MVCDIPNEYGEDVWSVIQHVRGKYGGKFGATDACLLP